MNDRRDEPPPPIQRERWNRPAWIIGIAIAALLIILFFVGTIP